MLKAAEANPRIKGVRLRQNMGKGYAVKAGMLLAHGERLLMVRATPLVGSLERRHHRKTRSHTLRSCNISSMISLYLDCTIPSN